MSKSLVCRKNVGIIAVILSFMFLFISCGSDNSVQTMDKFLGSIKERNVKQSYSYLDNNSDVETFKLYMNDFANPQTSGDASLDNLTSAMRDRVFDFTYEIIESYEENNSGTVTVKFNYFDFLKSYQDALSEFLQKALDFENLDNSDLYDNDNVANFLIDHINNAQKEEKTLEIKIVKNGSWKIVMDSDLMELLTGNIVTFMNALKDSTIIE